MPLQCGVLGGFFEFEGFEQVALLRVETPGADDGLLVELYFVFLDLTQQGQRALWRDWLIAGAQAFAQDSIHHEREKADQCMRANAIRQAMMDGGDVDVALVYPEATLDVSQCLVAGDHLT